MEMKFPPKVSAALAELTEYEMRDAIAGIIASSDTSLSILLDSEIQQQLDSESPDMERVSRFAAARRVVNQEETVESTEEVL